MMNFAAILKPFRSGQSFERVGYPQTSILDPVNFEITPHKNASSASLDPGFYEIALYMVIQYGLHVLLQIFYANSADHAIRDRRPVKTYTTHVTVRMKSFNNLQILGTQLIRSAK
ncbi:hypothetical protein QFZ80_004704 [Paenibacillus sp. V4I7]|nr:hypothetical protein [Paenibacillus sp. V4I7]